MVGVSKRVIAHARGERRREGYDMRARFACLLGRTGLLNGFSELDPSLTII